MSQLVPPPRSVRLFLCVLAVVQLATVLAAFEKPAVAYVDPGTGYVFLQVAGSMLAGAVFYLRHRLKKLFSFHRSQDAIPLSETNAKDGETS